MSLQRRASHATLRYEEVPPPTTCVESLDRQHAKKNSKDIPKPDFVIRTQFQNEFKGIKRKIIRKQIFFYYHLDLDLQSKSKNLSQNQEMTVNPIIDYTFNTQWRICDRSFMKLVNDFTLRLLVRA